MSDPAKGPHSVLIDKVEQILTEAREMHQRPAYEAKGVFLEAIKDEDIRNRAYQLMSEGYNLSLKDGEYELSVMFLMAMRWVLEYEDRPGDRKNMAMIADWIIINTMLKDS